MRRRLAGFSLIELLVVLAVLGVLAGMAMPLAEMSVQRERERELKRALWEIRDAIDAYKRASDGGEVARLPNGSGYPPDLESLVSGAPRATPSGEPLRFLRRLPRDPFAPPELAAARTWGVRSYRSTAERPEPGADVYDVYSLSTGRGLNGVPLKDW